MQKIGIVGQGFVGSAVKEGFKDYFKIETFDIAKECTCESLLELCEKSNIVFVCLPTPMEKGGKCHTGIVEEVLNEIDRLNFKHDFIKANTIVVKSTIPPGTTEMWNEKFENLDIVFNPEFLTEANALNDFKNQTRIVLGGERKANARVKRLFAKAFPKVPVIHTSSTIAEMVKYTTNSFLATKVSFANEVYQICEGLAIDYDKVIEYAKHDERLGYSHWNVPGPDGELGYGGHCFPKDIRALIRIATDLGLSPKMLQATDNKNNDVRKNRDWEQQKGRAVI
jgi:nucleotide sugar dehydrogenase